MSTPFVSPFSAVASIETRPFKIVLHRRAVVVGGGVVVAVVVTVFVNDGIVVKKFVEFYVNKNKTKQNKTKQKQKQKRKVEHTQVV